ncbi:MAG: isoprenylcysteine carboxylmethyltransferase family protein [Syntrophomonadaceae bacterium]|nr:isoprenylcysteine carboxylmethyltransferase family protein [Syntrophomonadaceae bacterium]
MDSRQRNVLIRMIIVLILFAYIGYLAWSRLPRFDFWVIMAFFAIYLTWSIIETIIYRAPETRAIEDDDRRSYVYLQLSSLFVLFYALMDFLEYHLTRINGLEPAINYAGFLLFFIYCLIRYRAIVSLGKYYNPRVALYEEHSLVKDRAYLRIRHPFYLSAMLSVLSITFIFNSWGSLLIVILAVIPAIIYRIKVEEEFLLRHFGESYKEYMGQTSRLIPKIW